MIKNLTLSLALAFAGLTTAFTADAVKIMHPSYNGGGVIHGLSNNGLYGVASINPEESGFSHTVGAVFYDLTGDTPKATNLSQIYDASAANDVTDDGKLVVGSINQKPAFCRFVNNRWTWSTLPMPSVTKEITNELGEGVITATINGGEVYAVTPDGKYAVGWLRSNEYLLMEMAAMWDLETGTLIDIALPGMDNYPDKTFPNHNQTRIMQLSDDANYLLCWSGFSYGGIVYIFDRKNNKPIFIDRVRNADGSWSPRAEGYAGIELDGISKMLTSDGRYMSGGISNAEDETFPFLFDVWNEKLEVLNDGVHSDVTGWSVTKDGIALGGTPANTLYANAVACFDGFQFPFETLYKNVYGIDLDREGIDVTGKPTLVSDDGRTVVFVVGNTESYVLKLDEDLRDAFDRIDLMSAWTVTPADGTKMSVVREIAVVFGDPVEVDASRYAEVKLLDEDGNVVATPMANGGVRADNAKMVITFRATELKEGKNYTLNIPAGIANIVGRKQNANPEISISYVGRDLDSPITVSRIDPADGTKLSSLDIEDNPIKIVFDVPVKINGTADNRPIAHLYVDDQEESAASLMLDVDLYTNSLIVYPPVTYYLYKGSEYVVKVPAGAVCDLSGYGANEELDIHFTGSYVPQMGDDLYLFRADGAGFENMLFYDGDKATPAPEYESFGFTADTTPWWIVYDDNGTDGVYASHSVYMKGEKADDWMVIRQIKVPTNVESYLSFKSQSYKKGKEDRLKVYIYEKDAVLNNLSSLDIFEITQKAHLVYNEVQSPGESESKLAGEWKENVIPLSDYKGKNIYICFRNDNQNQSMVFVDDIEVVKEVKAFLTLTNKENVVKQQSIEIKGIMSVVSELADYKSVKMTLLDGQDNKVSEVSASNLSLTAGDSYNFTFPQALPLTVGEENRFTIKYDLDDDEMIYEGFVRDLSFEPVKRVVVEEYTGRDCQFCPLGMLAMENLEARFADRVIPVALHAFESDPKGIGIYDYAAAVFSGNTAAPMGRINRRSGLNSPMASDEKANRFYYSSADVAGASPTWQDVVAAELNEPTYLDMSLEANNIQSSTRINYTLTVSSAINLSEQNIRVLGILLEDDIMDRQSNGLYTYDDPILGEYGKGGKFGNSSFRTQFYNVARGYWGQSVNGTPRLIPADIKVGESYPVEIEYTIPGSVSNRDNMKMVVMLIDENTGRVINATVEGAINGIEDIVDEVASSIEISKLGHEVVVEAGSDVEVAVYALDGRLLRSVHGYGNVSFSLEGYNGIVIVRAASAGNVVSKKLAM